MTIGSHGPGWFTMQYSGSKLSTLSLSPNITSEVYILKGSSGDPNNFNYDMSFTSIKGNTTFDAKKLGLTGDDGFSVAMYVPAMNETANEVLYGSIGVYFAEGASTLVLSLTSLSALWFTML